MPDDSAYRPASASEAQDDLLDVGRRRTVPRWTIGVLWAAVIAVAVTVLVVRGAASNQDAKPKPGPTSTGPQITSPISGESEGDLAIDGKYLYELSEGALYRLDITDPRSPVDDGVVTVGGLNRTLANVTFHLVVDGGSHHIWMVTYGASPATVVEFDSRTLREIGRVLWPSEVHAAAAFDGHLYLASTNAIVDIVSTKSTPTTIASLTGQYTVIVADPTRSRLLLLGVDSGFRVSTYTPADGRSTRGPPASFTKGGLVVVGGAIWAGGFGDKGALLARLDPAKLTPVAFSELSPQLGPGAIPVAAGQGVFWVRSGSGGDGLWCVSGASGNQLQYWQYYGAVASTHGAAFVAQRDGPFSLQLGACTG